MNCSCRSQTVAILCLHITVESLPLCKMSATCKSFLLPPHSKIIAELHMTRLHLFIGADIESFTQLLSFIYLLY